MLCRHVFDKISTKFCGIFRVFVNFADLPEFRGSATGRNIRSRAHTNQVGADVHWQPATFDNPAVAL